MLATLTGQNPVPPPPLPVVSLAVSPAAVAEDGATNLIFTFTRTGTTAAPLTVKYGIAGTATRGTDYTVVGGTPGTVTFAAGAARATVTVDPTADTAVEPHETVALTLAAGSGYSIGTARAVTGTITNDDAPAALPAATTVWAFNSGGNGSPPFDVRALPGYGVATSAVFYFSEGGWAGWSVPAGKVVLGAKIISAGDTLADFAVFKAAGPGEVFPHYAYGPAESGWVLQAKQANNGVQIEVYYADPPTVTVQVAPSSVANTVQVAQPIVAEDGPQKLTYTFTATGPLTRNITVAYEIGGSATAESDFTGLPAGASTGAITIPANSSAPGSAATLTITPTLDTVVEPDETVVITLQPGIGYTFDTARPPATGTIKNDDFEVDLDVDSDNADTIPDPASDPVDRSAAEEVIEEATDANGVIVRPGVIVPVGPERTKMIAEVPAGMTATLEFDPAAAKKVKVFLPSGAVALDTATLKTTVVGGEPRTFWIEAFAPSASLADIAFTLTLVVSASSGSAGSPPSDMIRATAVPPGPTVDIDVDSNNSGDIDDTDDPIEDIDPGVDVPAGARVFHNIDDDNRNREADKDDAAFEAQYEDLDLAEARLSTSDLRVINDNPLKKDGTYRLWLGVPQGLNVFADRRRTPLAADGTDGLWRYWNIKPDGTSTFPAKVFIEGLAIGQHEVTWQLCEPSEPGQNGPPQVATPPDIVDLSVEEMVFPTIDQRRKDNDEDWTSKNTSGWDGFVLKEKYPWIIEKPLVDFIKAKAPVGWLETTLKQPQPPDNANAPSLESRQTANGGSFTIEFAYEFDRSRGDETYGWVEANGQQKLSFVANSGVKFGEEYKTEIALLDVRAMVDRATITTNDVAYTGLDAFNPKMGKGITDAGKVVVDGLNTAPEQEEIARLLTAVAYNRDFAGVTDAPNMPPTPADRDADDYFEVLEAMYNRAGDAAGGTLKATYTAALSSLTIWLNGQQTYNRDTSEFDDNKQVGAVDSLQLQSHWGSGVRFKNIRISN
jgi:hypothetical protein